MNRWFFSHINILPSEEFHWIISLKLPKTTISTMSRSRLSPNSNSHLPIKECCVQFSPGPATSLSRRGFVTWSTFLLPVFVLFNTITSSTRHRNGKANRWCFGLSSFFGHIYVNLQFLKQYLKWFSFLFVDWKYFKASADLYILWNAQRIFEFSPTTNGRRNWNMKLELFIQIFRYISRGNITL